MQHISWMKLLRRQKSTSGGNEILGLTFMARITSWKTKRWHPLVTILWPETLTAPTTLWVMELGKKSVSESKLKMKGVHVLKGGSLMNRKRGRWQNTNDILTARRVSKKLKKNPLVAFIYSFSFFKFWASYMITPTQNSDLFIIYSNNNYNSLRLLRVHYMPGLVLSKWPAFFHLSPSRTRWGRDYCCSHLKIRKLNREVK